MCSGCVYGKQHHNSHPKNSKVAEKLLDVVHVDLCEMNIKSLGGAKYFILFKDEFSHFRTVYFLKTKDESAYKLKSFAKMVQNQFDSQIKCLKSDNGTEIKNVETRKFLDDLGVFHIKSNVYTPQQNGRIEREMRTIVDAARSALHAKDLNEVLWAEAINYAVFTINQTGTSSVQNKSPADLWFGRKVNLNKLKSFGCKCFVLIEDHKRAKTEKKSKQGIFVGYDLDSPCYRIYFPDINDVVSSDNVIFNENFEKGCTDFEVVLSDKEGDSDMCLEELHDNSVVNLESDESNSESEHSSNSEESQRIGCRQLRDRASIKVPRKYEDYDLGDSSDEHFANIAILGEVENISVTDALKDRKWFKAMSEEFESLTKMNTCDLVTAPKDVKPLTCKWVLRQKLNGHFKARLVARGFEQKKGIDYFDAFSPVTRHVSIRLILSLTASKKMKLMTFDVKTAFLYGNLEENIYMYQPEGFDDNTGRVCKLKKSLYGLKQSPKNWNDKFSNFLLSIGFNNTDNDPCVYYCTDRSIIIALFVDDGLIVEKDKGHMIKVLTQLKREFKITFNVSPDGNLSYLGMQIYQTEEGIFLNQPNFFF